MPAPKKTYKPIKPSPNKSDRISDVQVEANGGRINVGGNVGNVFGAGRRRSGLRQLCADGFEKAIPRVVEIATGKNEKASASDEISAMDKLGKYGLGELRVEVKDPHIFEALGEVLPRHVDAALAHAILTDLYGELGGSDTDSEE